MLKIIFCFLYSFLFIMYQPLFADIRGSVDRKELVEAANSLMSPMLKLYLDNLDNKTLLEEDKEFLKQLSSILQDSEVKLEYTNNQKYFDIIEGQTTRLMSTDAKDIAGPIFVNLSLLQDERSPLSLMLTFKFLFHEYAHKTQYKDYHCCPV